MEPYCRRQGFFCSSDQPDPYLRENYSIKLNLEIKMTLKHKNVTTGE